jgi:hypothetical protein
MMKRVPLNYALGSRISQETRRYYYLSQNTKQSSEEQLVNRLWKEK